MGSLQSDTILIEILFILLHFFAWRLNLLIFKRQVFHPAILFSFLWFFIILFHFIVRHTVLQDLFKLSISTHLVFLGGVVFFTLGALLQAIYSPVDTIKRTTFLQETNLSLNKYLCLTCTIVVIVGLPFFIKACFNLFLLSETENFFEGIRTELCYGDVDIGPSKYLVTLSFIALALNFILYFNSNDKKFSRILLVVSIIANLVYIIFTTGRTYYVMLFAIYFGSSYLYSNSFSLKKVLIACIAFLLVFSIIGIAFYSKGGHADNSLNENSKSAIESIAIYAFTPLNACGTYIDNIKPDDTGDRTLRTFKRVLFETGIDRNSVVRPLIEEYVFVPYPTNVYALYGPYIADFGSLYAFLIIAFLGFLHTLFFNRFKYYKSIKFSLYYIFMLFPLFLSFFEDQYFSLFSMWIQIIVIVEIICFINKILIKNYRVEHYPNNTNLNNNA
ncbi:O-antigen polymerase [Ferruginibacter albus]|uniref:O-antigen polymerase n=1 Tax=Ferruginibacter albus TaxID=2875540 RepID=UPI001CC64433|nr:O-antigen polymerase [Ferruginibacter albus]UAY52250.1 oligosaccharide repeat unit polymerase [Ferruginibacter albus]